MTAPGSTAAQIDLDGTAEALGNFTLRNYGVGNTWSLAAWVRPGIVPTLNSKYVFDLNGQMALKSASRISLTLAAGGRFSIEVSDAAGNARSIAAPTPINPSQVPNAWYHVVAVKNGACPRSRTCRAYCASAGGSRTARTTSGRAG